MNNQYMQDILDGYVEGQPFEYDGPIDNWAHKDPETMWGNDWKYLAAQVEHELPRELSIRWDWKDGWFYITVRRECIECSEDDPDLLTETAGGPVCDECMSDPEDPPPPGFEYFEDYGNIAR